MTYYLCGTCGTIYTRFKAPSMKMLGSRVKGCCGHPMQRIDKKTKEQIEAKNDQS